MDIDATQVLSDNVIEEDEEGAGNNVTEGSVVAQLHVLQHKSCDEMILDLHEGKNIIGRTADRCDVPIPVKSLSKQHAYIEIHGDSAWVLDMGSRNRSKKGKHHIEPNVKYGIDDGDILTFADVHCQFNLLHAKEEAEKVAEDVSEAGSESMIAATQPGAAGDMEAIEKQTVMSDGVDSEPSSDLLQQPTQAVTRFAVPREESTPTQKPGPTISVVEETPFPLRKDNTNQQGTDENSLHAVSAEKQCSVEDTPDNVASTSVFNQPTQMLVGAPKFSDDEDDDQADEDDTLRASKTRMLLTQTHFVAPMGDNEDDAILNSKTQAPMSDALQAETQNFSSDDTDRAMLNMETQVPPEIYSKVQHYDTPRPVTNLADSTIDGDSAESDKDKTYSEQPTIVCNITDSQSKKPMKIFTTPTLSYDDNSGQEDEDAHIFNQPTQMFGDDGRVLDKNDAKSSDDERIFDQPTIDPSDVMETQDDVDEGLLGAATQFVAKGDESEESWDQPTIDPSDMMETEDDVGEDMLKASTQFVANADSPTISEGLAESADTLESNDREKQNIVEGTSLMVPDTHLVKTSSSGFILEEKSEKERKAEVDKIDDSIDTTCDSDERLLDAEKLMLSENDTDASHVNENSTMEDVALHLSEESSQDLIAELKEDEGKEAESADNKDLPELQDFADRIVSDKSAQQKVTKQEQIVNAVKLIDSMEDDAVSVEDKGMLNGNEVSENELSKEENIDIPTTSGDVKGTYPGSDPENIKTAKELSSETILNASTPSNKVETASATLAQKPVVFSSDDDFSFSVNAETRQAAADQLELGTQKSVALTREDTETSALENKEDRELLDERLQKKANEDDDTETQAYRQTRDKTSREIAEKEDISKIPTATSEVQDTEEEISPTDDLETQAYGIEDEMEIQAYKQSGEDKDTAASDASCEVVEDSQPSQDEDIIAPILPGLDKMIHRHEIQASAVVGGETVPSKTAKLDTTAGKHKLDAPGSDAVVDESRSVVTKGSIRQARGRRHKRDDKLNADTAESSSLKSNVKSLGIEDGLTDNKIASAAIVDSNENVANVEAVTKTSQKAKRGRKSKRGTQVRKTIESREKEVSSGRQVPNEEPVNSDMTTIISPRRRRGRPSKVASEPTALTQDNKDETTNAIEDVKNIRSRRGRISRAASEQMKNVKGEIVPEIKEFSDELPEVKAAQRSKRGRPSRAASQLTKEANIVEDVVPEAKETVSEVKDSSEVIPDVKSLQKSKRGRPSKVVSDELSKVTQNLEVESNLDKDDSSELSQDSRKGRSSKRKSAQSELTQNSEEMFSKKLSVAKISKEGKKDSLSKSAPVVDKAVQEKTAVDDALQGNRRKSKLEESVISARPTRRNTRHGKLLPVAEEAAAVSDVIETSRGKKVHSSSNKETEQATTAQRKEDHHIAKTKHELVLQGKTEAHVKNDQLAYQVDESEYSPPKRRKGNATLISAQETNLDSPSPKRIRMKKAVAETVSLGEEIAQKTVTNPRRKTRRSKMTDSEISIHEDEQELSSLPIVRHSPIKEVHDVLPPDTGDTTLVARPLRKKRNRKSAEQEEQAVVVTPPTTRRTKHVVKTEEISSLQKPSASSSRKGAQHLAASEEDDKREPTVVPLKRGRKKISPVNSETVVIGHDTTGLATIPPRRGRLRSPSTIAKSIVTPSKVILKSIASPPRQGRNALPAVTVKLEVPPLDDEPKPTSTKRGKRKSEAVGEVSVSSDENKTEEGVSPSKRGRLTRAAVSVVPEHLPIAETSHTRTGRKNQSAVETKAATVTLPDEDDLKQVASSRGRRRKTVTSKSVTEDTSKLASSPSRRKTRGTAAKTEESVSSTKRGKSKSATSELTRTVVSPKVLASKLEDGSLPKRRRRGQKVVQEVAVHEVKDETIPIKNLKSNRVDVEVDEDDSVPSKAERTRGRKPKVQQSETPVRKNRLKQQATSPRTESPSLRRSLAELKPKVMFTGIIDPALEKIVVQLGGELATSVYTCTHLVTDVKVKRTCKFLSIAARGQPIVTPQWLQGCKEAKMFCDPQQYLTRDAEAEKKWKFNLKRTLSTAAKKGGIFSGHKIHVTKNVKPPPADMEEIILCAGGVNLKGMPSINDGNTVVVSCEEDRGLCKSAINNNIPIVSNEFVLSGVLQYRADSKKFAL